MIGALDEARLKWLKRLRPARGRLLTLVAMSWILFAIEYVRRSRPEWSAPILVIESALVILGAAIALSARKALKVERPAPSPPPGGIYSCRVLPMVALTILLFFAVPTGYILQFLLLQPVSWNGRSVLIGMLALMAFPMGVAASIMWSTRLMITGDGVWVHGKALGHEQFVPFPEKLGPWTSTWHFVYPAAMRHVPFLWSVVAAPDEFLEALRERTKSDM